MTHPICPACETVAHCSRNGCIPVQPQTTNTEAMRAALLPCPFCGDEAPEFERMGTARQSCIVVCGNCGVRHESSDEGARSGSSWNNRAALAQAEPPHPTLSAGLANDDGSFTTAAELNAFQHRVQPWMLACFGAEIAADRQERNHRFFEEATELVQACGMTASEAHQLVDYTFGRAIGEPVQEVGGVMVTLAALCLANGLNMHSAGDTELARIWTKVEAIRAKQASKPKHSPLPGQPQPSAWVGLTDEEEVALPRKWEGAVAREGGGLRLLVRMTAEELRAKNARSVGEDVAHVGWLAQNKAGHCRLMTDLEIAASNGEYTGVHKLYALGAKNARGVGEDAKLIEAATKAHAVLELVEPNHSATSGLRAAIDAALRNQEEGEKG